MMKVSNGHIIGSSLGLFLIFCISMNGDVVSGQSVRIGTVLFSDNLSGIILQTCFNSLGQASGEILVATFPDILNQPEMKYAVTVSNVRNLCENHWIPVTILFDQLGTGLSVTIEASAVTNPPFAVNETANVSFINIPGPTLSFQMDMYEVTEGDVNGNTKAMLTVCQTPSTFSSSASVAILGLNAEVDSDYSEVTSLTTLQPTEECTTLQIDIISDNVAEENEIFLVQLQEVSPSRVSASNGRATVTIIDDDNPMTTFQCPEDMLVTALPPSTSTNVQFSTPQCVDNQQVSFPVTCTPSSGSLYNAGSNTVVCTCTVSGVIAASCTFTITVQVNQPPTVQCPENMFVTALPPSIPTTAQFNTPQCVDNEEINFPVTCTPSSGSSINVGSNTVTCTCTDGGVLAAACTFIITVQMYQPPTVQCPADMSVTAPLLSTSATVSFNTPQCLDNEQVNFPVTCTPSSESSINVGSNTVTCTCTDGGVLAASCTFVVTVQIDPCLIQPCDGDATCTHNEGLVKCTCTDGFYGDGTMNGTGCTECPRNVPDEKFGSNCSSPCTCASNAECFLVTGVCYGTECGDPMQPTCDKNNLNVMILQGDMDVDEKTAFTLNCTVNLGTADVTVTWSNPAGAEVQSGIVRRELSSTLTVLNAGKEDSGTYTCIAWLKKPTETVTSRNDSVNVNVRDFPEIDNLILQEISSSSLKFTWEVKDYGNDNITCRANYSEIENNNKKSKICEETSCELSNLSPNTDYIISVVCNNTAGPSNTLSMTSTTSSTVPEEVPDFNDVAVNSTFITVTLMPVSTENGPISCYEFVVAERSEVGTEPDKDFPFSSVKENSGEGTPYRAIVLNHDEYTAQKTVMIGAEGNQESMCVLPGNSRSKRASELVSSQILTARNDPLESANNYSIFLRIYVLSTNGEYCYESSSYQSFKTKSDNSTEMPQSPMTGLVVALIVIVFIIILVVSIAVVVIFKRKSTQTDSAKRQSNKADVSYDNEGLSRSTVYVNEQQTSNVDALLYEPVQNQASGGIQLDKLPRTLPDSKVESSYDYEVTGLPKQNTALPEPPVSQDLDKVIYEDMPDELNYSHALYNQEKAPVPFKVSELPEYIHQRRLGGRNALEMEFMTLPQGQLEPWTEAVKKQNVYKGRNPDVLP